MSSSAAPPIATVRRLALATRPSPVLAVFYSLSSSDSYNATSAATTMRVHRIDLAAHLFSTPEAAAAALVRSALVLLVCAFRLCVLSDLFVC